MEFRELLVGLVLVWLAAKVAGEGMERIGQTAVLGELLAGVLIGQECSVSFGKPRGCTPWPSSVS